MSSDAHVTLEPGFRLDRYELLCPIAQGGMAQVWLARLHGKRGFEKLVAVKTILAQYATDLRFQQMFLDEARIASGIEHPNVAQIFDLGEHGDLLYLVMEWVDGESLSKLVRAADREGKRIPIGIVARICADACAGLHAAHELSDKSGNLLNVVHRDVSPQNVLVSVKGAVKVIDFGIAKARDRYAGDTSTGMFKGKILYMAPEQAVGKPVDRRADVWAVGALMYHMLAGRPAYEGDNQMATLHMLTNPSVSFEPLPEEVPAPLREVVGRALVRDVDARVATAQELGLAIEEAMVAAKLSTTPRDVAKYVTEQLRERNDARRKAVDLALEAAGQRQRFNAQLESPFEDSSTGARMVKAAMERPATPASVPSMEPPSAATLGSATLPADEALPTRSNRPLVIGAAVAAVLLGMIGLAVRLGSSGGPAPASATSSATASAPPTSSTASTVAPTTIASVPATTSPTDALTPPPRSSSEATTKPVVSGRSVVSPPGATTPPPTATAAPRPSTTASAKKRVIDDGF